VSSVSTATLILFERTGRWAASLRRHDLVERLRLIETRSLVELDEHLASNGNPLVGVELTQVTAGRVLEWLGRAGGVQRASGVIVLADRSLRPYEFLCREAGAAHFVCSLLELLTLGPVIDRYLSRIPLGDANGAELSTPDRIRAQLPWRS
jgi:hypothetical protein